ncbi:MAG: hypothetical protein P4M12_07575 [Gammaproteobacteria bacterium]|nr:hypothetical protein [Gammaproteobacteria bacterium]
MHPALHSSTPILPKKNLLLLVLLFGIICISLLSPIASNDYVPAQGDFKFHLSAIMEAKEALEEGQFPIKIAPSQTDGLRNAFFQFYSPLPYTVAAVIYKSGCSNPYVAYKITIWLALMLACFFMFQLITRLTQSVPIAILSSLVYITAPYLLININTRGDFTEVIAQCLIPMVIYFNMKVFFSRFSILNSILAILSWQCLLLSHLLTFVYSTLFIFLFFLVLTYQEPSYLKRYIHLLVIYFFTCILGAWHLAPIILFANQLNVSAQLLNPFIRAWLTPIATLLSPSAVSPEPLPGNNLLTLAIYCSIGWVMLLAMGYNFYLICQKNVSMSDDLKKITQALLFVMVIAIIAVWSPINFWHYLPKTVSSIQFPYRLLTQTMWVGTILFAFACLHLFKKLDDKHVLLGILLIGISSSSWLPTNNNGTLLASEFLHHTEIADGNKNYIISFIQIFKSKQLDNIQHQFFNTPNNIKINTPIFLPTNYFYANHNQKLIIHPNLNNQASPHELDVKINGLNMVHLKLNKNNGWEIPIGQLAPHTQNDFFILTFISADTTLKSINVKSLTISNTEPNILLDETITHSICTQENTMTHCSIKTIAPNTFVQLPIFYYPNMLSITVNGKPADYTPSLYYKNYVLAGVNLSPGLNEITVQFTGIKWANWLSLSVFSFLMFGIVLLLLSRDRQEAISYEIAS